MTTQISQIAQTAMESRTTIPSRWVTCAVLFLIAVATLGAVFGGPGLGDHEAIVAQCARNMRLSGDWVVPQIFDTPFFRKPPLPYWLIAGVSYLLPNDAQTGLPVTALAARLPSALAALVTILLTWHLGTCMFGRRAGLVTAVISSSSLVFLLYAPNATAEMLLTMCCTWAYVHFWHTVTAQRPGPRFVHAMLFYVAMGFGMLAKGPAPIALVAMPLFVWWFAERPLRILARQGLVGIRKAAVCFVRNLWPRTKQAFTRLWLVPGLIVFAAVFVPWMLAVAERYPHAWDLWNWQYWQRAQGNYEDTRVRGAFYYIPIVIGLALPWAFLLVEALLAPWLRRYAHRHRALLFAGMWTVLATAVMSLMQFKKPYYTLPALPGLLLLLGVVADRLYAWRPSSDPLTWCVRFGAWQRTIRIVQFRRTAWIAWGVTLLASAVAVVAAGYHLHGAMPVVSTSLTLIFGSAVFGLLVAAALFILDRGWHTLALTAVTVIVAFHCTWYASGAAVDTAGEMGKVASLAKALDVAGVPPQAKVFWTDGRPDARLSFYFNRNSTYLITPEEIVSRMVDRTNKGSQLQWLVLGRAESVLKAAEPVYLILQQSNYAMVKDSLPAGCHVVTSVQGRNERPGKTWVVVSNNVPGS